MQAENMKLNEKETPPQISSATFWGSFSHTCQQIWDCKLLLSKVNKKVTRSWWQLKCLHVESTACVKLLQDFQCFDLLLYFGWIFFFFFFWKRKQTFNAPANVWFFAIFKIQTQPQTLILLKFHSNCLYIAYSGIYSKRLHSMPQILTLLENEFPPMGTLWHFCIRTLLINGYFQTE